MNRPELVRLLLENSAKKYYVIYEGFLYNHISHGIIALQRLAAGSERIQRFLEWYRPKLEPSDRHIAAENGGAIIANPEKILGARKSFYALCTYYEQQLASHGGSLEKLIAVQLPLLGRGLAGSALHGIIHLGYGYSARSDAMVCEGLAYMHYAYVSPTLSATDSCSSAIPDRSILDVLSQVRDDVTLSQLIRSEVVKPEWQEYDTGNFQRNVEILFKYRGDDLMKWARSVKEPSDVVDAATRSKWMVNSAITVYATSERRNDFFLLHGVTAAWSLMQVLPLIGDSAIERELNLYFICTLLSAYKAQGAPTLLMDSLHDDSCRGIKIRPSWDTVIRDALSADHDEHVFKLVQVCRDMDDGNTDADLTRLYLTAASIVLDFPFVYHVEPKDV